MKEVWKDIEGYEDYYQVSNMSAGNSDAERFRREVMAASGKPVIVAGE